MGYLFDLVMILSVPFLFYYLLHMRYMK